MQIETNIDGSKDTLKCYEDLLTKSEVLLDK